MTAPLKTVENPRRKSNEPNEFFVFLLSYFHIYSLLKASHDGGHDEYQAKCTKTADDGSNLVQSHYRTPLDESLIFNLWFFLWHLESGKKWKEIFHQNLF